MKKSIFVLSALLTLVVSGICLQSCSSEYDEYTTEEEYGYYTEEETNAVKEMASKYGLSVVVNPDYYGVKRSLSDIEEEMKGLSSILGEYEIILDKCTQDKRIYTSCREMGRTRATPRYVEGNGDWGGEETTANRTYKASVSISWDMSKEIHTQKASGNVVGYKLVNPYNHTYEEIGDGQLTCSFLGESSIQFSGGFNTEREESDESEEKTYLVTYSFSIHGGNLDTRSNSGSFTITASENKVLLTPDE